MKVLAVCLSGAWIGLAGCVGSPKSLGITGPGTAGLGGQPMAPSAAALDPDASTPAANPAQDDTAIPAPWPLLANLPAGPELSRVNALVAP